MGLQNSLHFDAILQSAHASEKHPFQTNVQFILTDFKPNKNKQAIPESEATNIIATAVGMPVKIRFNGIGAQGHAGSRPIGPITRAWVEDDKILAEATVWNREFSDIDLFLKTANAEQKTIGTSWELFFQTETKDSDDVSWLSDIVFAATTIVDNPAYGKDRTRIFAISEDMMLEDETPTPEADKIMLTVNDLYELASVLMDMWHETYEEELARATLDNATAIVDRARSILNTMRDKKQAMAEEKELLDKIAELEAANLALAEFKTTTERTILFAARAETLKDLFSADDITARKDMILALSEDAFTAYVGDLQAVKKPAVAEVQNKVRVPDLAGNAGISIATLAQELNQLGAKK